MSKEVQVFKIGDKVLVFDHTLYRDDISTPLSVTMKAAKVILGNYAKETISITEYGTKTKVDIDLVDVEFEHRGFSKGHFASTIIKRKRG